jgi:hypothetical protein
MLRPYPRGYEQCPDVVHFDLAIVAAWRMSSSDFSLWFMLFHKRKIQLRPSFRCLLGNGVVATISTFCGVFAPGEIRDVTACQSDITSANRR